MKILVAAYVAGRQLLEKRLVVDCWRRLIRLSEKWNKTISNFDKTQMVKRLDALPVKCDNFSKVRKEMGYGPCELRTMLMADIYRQQKFKV